ncbi:hypothetical protein DRO33_00640 [Candidatus Bathyarchaeota archaeon]|nr:MAG: hypothetical protein DRO33_00640 [Candidatus Bathyarchaeota archaeon]
MSSATSRLGSGLIKSLPPEVLAKAIDKFIDKIPPSLVVSAMMDLVKGSLEKGIRTDVDVTVMGIRVKGNIVVKSPP